MTVIRISSLDNSSGLSVGADPIITTESGFPYWRFPTGGYPEIKRPDGLPADYPAAGHFVDIPAGNYLFQGIGEGRAEPLDLWYYFELLDGTRLASVHLKAGSAPSAFGSMGGTVPDISLEDQLRGLIPPAPPTPPPVLPLGIINGVEIFADEIYTGNIYKNNILTSSGDIKGSDLWHLFQNGYTIVFGEPIPVELIEVERQVWLGKYNEDGTKYFETIIVRTLAPNDSSGTTEIVQIG